MVNKFILLFTLLFTHISYADEFDTQMDKGYRLPLEFITKDFLLLRRTPEPQYLQKYIVKTNFKIASEEAAKISNNVLTISDCLGLDPWILTGLIQKESSFSRTATSPTGAVGLTQFTTIGIKEVNDQLGMRGKVGAPEPVIDYLTSQIRSCVDADWIDFWTRLSIEETHPDFYPLFKEELKKDVTGSVLYGAILLKIYLGVISTRNNLDSDSVTPLKTSDAYYLALQMYNGEEGDAKIKYAKNIFLNVKTMYPVEVNFPY